MAKTKTCEIYPDLFEPYPKGTLHPKDEASKKRLADINTINTKRAGFFNSLRYLLINQFNFSAMPVAPDVPPGGPQADDDLLHGLSADDKAQFVGIAGHLLADGVDDPLTGRKAQNLTPDEIVVVSGVPIYLARGFVQATVAAFQDYSANKGVYRGVFDVLSEQGTTGTGASKTTTVKARQVAEVTERLVQLGVEASDPQFRFQAQNALAQVLKGTTDGLSSQIDIELIDLEEGAEAEIIEANVRALSAIYCAAMLEELKFFAVADNQAEQFTQGTLPMTRGSGGDRLYRYIRKANERMTEVERRSLYARCFGLAQGSVEERLPNREFSDLWIRFLSAMSFFAREATSTERKKSTASQVIKSARDVAVNLSLHGFGFAHPGAVELQLLIKDVKDMLSAPDILAAWGAKDCWQLTERVSAAYLGGSVNSVRQRTLAQSGARIISWLADRHKELASGIESLNLSYDDPIVHEIESWLAVTGTTDQSVQKFSDPVVIQTQRTIPDFSPQTMMPDFQAAFDKMNTLSNTQLPQA